MKNLIVYINEKLKITKDLLKQNKHNYHPKTREELKELVKKLIEERGNDADLNDIDTSAITDMAELFDGVVYKDNLFNGDISGWDVSNVKTMKAMFWHSEFTGENGDISNWDVSNVYNMYAMFYKSKFNGDISKWDVSNVKFMRSMFESSEFKNDISNWDVSNVKDRSKMFWHCKINKNFKPKFNK